MKERIAVLWNNISRIGLREGEDVLNSREIILLNRLMALMFIVMVFYVPFEVIIFGWSMIPIVVLMVGSFLVTLVFHRFRLFMFARYYLYVVATLFIVVMGLSVGKGIDNYVLFAPIVLLATILFKSRVVQIIFFIVTVALFLLEFNLYDVIPAQFDIPDEVRPMFSMLFFVLSLILTFMVGIYFTAINREYEGIMVMQKERLELKNKEITDSITYAKRIQTAILPPLRIVKAHLRESFILYKPKDIVAGDFYWMESFAKASDCEESFAKASDSERAFAKASDCEGSFAKASDPKGQNENLILFAAADCTGHGVPGAMVSVVCNNALNRSVREYGLTDPGKILDKTREIVVQEFEKSDEEVKDGMDISLCAYDPVTRMLKWAGANNPVWIVRDGVLQEVKGDKQPIGKHSEQKPFTTHTIQLSEGTAFYIFTDGYYDQFGGDKGKKFKAAKMKELLLSIYQRPMDEQRDIIDETFETWKDNLEQIDDVCVIGVRV